eukprot:COSAG03_NODE_18611_length_351_cov_1.392857_1_plen_84_part_01
MVADWWPEVFRQRTNFACPRDRVQDWTSKKEYYQKLQNVQSNSGSTRMSVISADYSTEVACYLDLLLASTHSLGLGSAVKKNVC